VQAVLLGLATKRLGEHRAAHLSCALMLLGFLALAPISTVPQLCLVLLPLGTGGVMFSTINTAQLTKAVPSGQQGTMLAIDMSLGSGVRMVSPALAAAMLQRAGYSSIGLSAAALAAVTLLVFQSGLCRDVEVVKPEEKKE
jgi:OCT family organic cation transporter-like MFS transporter 18